MDFTTFAHTASQPNVWFKVPNKKIYILKKQIYEDAKNPTLVNILCICVINITVI